MSHLNVQGRQIRMKSHGSKFSYLPLADSIKLCSFHSSVAYCPCMLLHILLFMFLLKAAIHGKYKNKVSIFRVYEHGALKFQMLFTGHIIKIWNQTYHNILSSIEQFKLCNMDS